VQPPGDDGQWSYASFSHLLKTSWAASQKQLAHAAAFANSTRRWRPLTLRNPTVNRQQVPQLASCDIRQHRNILICGPTGTGKTHLPSPGMRPAAGRCPLYLRRQARSISLRADGSLPMLVYLRPDLLVLDFGLSRYSHPATTCTTLSMAA
jgi:hypothetical protein